MDPMMGVASAYIPYDYAQYPPMPVHIHMMHPTIPATPTTSYLPPMYPDTTVQSGSEFGNSPPSSGSSSNPSKKKVRSPEEEKKYRVKRARNNKAAQKSRKSRYEREKALTEENNVLKNSLQEANQEIANLKAQLAAVQFNGENIPPPIHLSYDPKAFQGMSIHSMSLHPQ